MISEFKLRSQGRPTRDSGGVGPDRIVEAARALLRTHPKAEITRKSMAQAAGVTPALVSYYFCEQSILLHTAAAPIVSDHMDQLYAIIGSSTRDISGLKQLIHLFISFNRTESLLLDNYMNLIKAEPRYATEGAKIGQAYQDLVEFTKQILLNEGWSGIRPAWLVFAMWGMCKAIAQTPILPFSISQHDMSDEDLIAQQTEEVLALVSGGGPAHVSGPKTRQEATPLFA